MLKSVLLHLDGSWGSCCVMELGANVAQSHGARVRGLSILDTREMNEMASSGAVACAASEAGKLVVAELRQTVCHQTFERFYQQTDLDCASRGTQGNPLDVLVREAHFHDLLITSHPAMNLNADGFLQPREQLELTERTGHPHYISRGENVAPERALLVYDGTEASARAIRAFLTQDPLPAAHCRLLGVDTVASPGDRRLKAMTEYCQARRSEMEVGCLRGSSRRVLIPYAKKWEADLVVLGITRPSRLFGRFFGQSALDLLYRSSHDLYLMA